MLCENILPYLIAAYFIVTLCSSFFQKTAHFYDEINEIIMQASKLVFKKAKNSTIE